MEQVKLTPKQSYLHLDLTRLSLNLPDIDLHIEEEKKPQNSSIIILKPKVKSNSNELF